MENNLLRLESCTCLLFNLLYTLDNLGNCFWVGNKPKTFFHLLNKILVDCLSSCLCFIPNNLQSVPMKCLELKFQRWLEKYKKVKHYLGSTPLTLKASAFLMDKWFWKICLQLLTVLWHLSQLVYISPLTIIK